MSYQGATPSRTPQKADQPPVGERESNRDQLAFMFSPDAIKGGNGLACPYFKMHPERYEQHIHCHSERAKPWTVNQMTQHLWRFHSYVSRCPYCDKCWPRTARKKLAEERATHISNCSERRRLLGQLRPRGENEVDLMTEEQQDALASVKKFRGSNAIRLRKIYSAIGFSCLPDTFHVRPPEFTSNAKDNISHLLQGFGPTQDFPEEDMPSKDQLLSRENIRKFVGYSPSPNPRNEAVLDSIAASRDRSMSQDVQKELPEAPEAVSPCTNVLGDMGLHVLGVGGHPLVGNREDHTQVVVRGPHDLVADLSGSLNQPYMQAVTRPDLEGVSKEEDPLFSSRHLETSSQTAATRQDDLNLVSSQLSNHVESAKLTSSQLNEGPSPIHTESTDAETAQRVLKSPFQDDALLFDPMEVDDTGLFNSINNPSPILRHDKDSGYQGSVSTDSKPVNTSMFSGPQKQTALESLPESATDSEQGDPNEDSATVYTAHDYATLTNYVTKFTELIVEALPNQSILHLKSQVLSVTIPKLLEAFAIKLGFCDASSPYREMMSFLHRYRQQIVQSITEKLEDANNQSLHFPGDAMTIDDKLENWDPICEAFEIDAKLILSSDDFSPADDEEEFDDLDEVDEELNKYHQLLVKSPAYKWLVHKLKAEWAFETVGEDVRMGIHQQLLDLFDCGRKRILSRSIRPPTAEMMFHIPWNLTEFFESRGYDVPAHEALPHVMVLNGSGNNVQAIACKEYVAQVWPFYGPTILEVIQRLLRGEKQVRDRVSLSDQTWIHAQRTSEIPGDWRVSQVLLMCVTGSVHSVAEIGEVLAWLRASLTSLEGNTGVYTSYPIIIERSVRTSEASNLPDVSMRKSCSIRPSIERIGSVRNQPALTDVADCWLSLLSNDICVKGFPTAGRPAQQTGLEVPLDMMIALADCQRLENFAGKFLIKGFDFVISPVKLEDNIIYWHLLANKKGEHMSYTDERILDLWRTYPPNLTVQDLESCRHILGWCGNADNLAGTSEASYRNIAGSGLGAVRPGVVLEKISTSFGMYANFGASATLLRRSAPVAGRIRERYTQKLHWISEKFVVLYDREDQRAWLVDGASALLHLVRTTLERDRQSQDWGQFCLFRDGLTLTEPQESHRFAGRTAALFVLNNEKNTSLALFAQPTRDELTETTTANGSSTTTLTRSKQNESFSDRVEDLYSALEKVVGHHQGVACEDGIKLRLQHPARRRLEGYDFMDIVTGSDPCFRFVEIRAMGPGWVDLIRALGAITLFGTGFGDLIRPSSDRESGCPSCLFNFSAPKNQEYLAVCSTELNTMLEKRGFQHKTRLSTLSEGLYWGERGDTFQHCQCSQHSTMKQDRIQVLLRDGPAWSTKGLTTPTSLPERGAVLFGHSGPWIAGLGNYLGRKRPAVPAATIHHTPQTSTQDESYSIVGTGSSRKRSRA